MRPCFSSKVQWNRIMAGGGLFDLYPILGTVAVTACAVNHDCGSGCADLCPGLVGPEFLLGAARRHKEFSPLADRFSASILYQRGGSVRFSDQRLVCLCPDTIAERFCTTQGVSHRPSDRCFYAARNGMHCTFYFTFPND